MTEHNYKLVDKLSSSKDGIKQDQVLLSAYLDFLSESFIVKVSPSLPNLGNDIFLRLSPSIKCADSLELLEIFYSNAYYSKNTYENNFSNMPIIYITNDLISFELATDLKPYKENEYYYRLKIGVNTVEKIYTTYLDKETTKHFWMLTEI